jgi:hypothetical protein
VRCVLALALVVAGCGRLNFAPEGGEDGGASDGPMDDGISGDTNGDGGTGAFTVYAVSGDGVGPTELMTLDLKTGILTTVGTIPASFGIVGGLAYWDSNLLYGTANNALFQITLSPFSVVNVSTTMAGTWSAVERDGTMLFGVDQDGDGYGRFNPASPNGPIPIVAIGFDAIGGDVVRTSGNWYWYSNTGTQLYIIDIGSPTPVGSPAPGAPFISGMTADNAGNLYVTSADTDLVYPISRTTGQFGQGVVLSKAGSAYNLLSGDLTRSP